jgi:hypothetical protein
MNRERLAEIKQEIEDGCTHHEEMALDLITALESAWDEIERLNDKVLDLEQNP